MGYIVYRKTIKNKALLNRLALILANVIGLGLLVGGMCFFSHVSEIEKVYKPVIATIENIEQHSTHRDGKTRVDHDVTVSYQVNGSTYRRQLNEYSSSMEVGGSVSLMYNPADPSEVHSTEIGKVIAIVFMVVGAVVLLMYWLVMRRILRKVLLRPE